jgi:GNAT superfamily N-acetyltransferase
LLDDMTDASSDTRAGHPIVLRVVQTNADLERWASIKSLVVPTQPVTAEQLHRSAGPDRVLLLAELDGAAVGAGIADRSEFGSRAFIAARVLPEHRRRGVGTALVRALSDHARALGLERMTAYVDAAEPHSIAFARQLGLSEVDYQLEQARAIGDEPEAVAPAGIEIVQLGARRAELLEAVWPVAREGYDDLPLEGGSNITLDAWLRDEATRPDGSFAAFEHGEPVGYAGLLVHADGDAIAEHGLTVVRRDRRGRGIARALKRSQIRWAAQSGVAELVTWTQQGNEAMQTLNRSLGYVDRSKELTFRGPVPPPAA